MHQTEMHQVRAQQIKMQQAKVLQTAVRQTRRQAEVHRTEMHLPKTVPITVTDIKKKKGPGLPAWRLRFLTSTVQNK